MKRTINDITYDTNKAEEIASADIRPLEPKHDDDYAATTLYRSEELFFLVEENPSTGRPRIIPLEKDDAIMWFNQHIEK